MSDSSSLQGSESTADESPVVWQDARGDLVSQDMIAVDHASTLDEEAADNTQQAWDHYLVRFQIWDDKHYNWKPYDPSHVKPIVPRQDLYNYFYLDIRYSDDRSQQKMVVTNFSTTLIDFLRFAIGDGFFQNEPEYPILAFFMNRKGLKADLAEVYDVLASNLAGDALKTKAKDMGCTDALEVHRNEEGARYYFEDVAEHLRVLLDAIDQQFEPTAAQLELELSYGHIAYGLLLYYFEPGLKCYTLQEGDMTGFTVRDARYKESGGFALNGTITRWDGHKFINEKKTFVIAEYNGTTELSQLPCGIMTDDIRAKLMARGRLYASLAGIHYKSYKGQRIIIDQLAFDKRGAYTCDLGDNIPDVSEDELDQLPSLVCGFDIKNKIWQSFHVEEIGDIQFDDKAWDHLVIDDDVKHLIKGLVNVTTNVNTSQHIVNDVITGKGGGLIAALHGPPGTGKTLTAEAVAEHLKRPLYIVNSLELSTFPAVLESKLSDILNLATIWDAVVLIDEADVFLEQRSLHELERNALVSVALKVLEYHRGVLFLTTNRIQTFDEAFLSRFSIAIKYPELNPSSRLTIWRKFFELAGCPLWGSEPEGFVTLDGKEPRCYVSLSDLEILAQKPFNGRTIKNLVRTAQALALSANEPLSLDHVKVVVRVQEKFLTQFAQGRS
ncbi:P-loop containing nucleoside triphosphate hydrolase protein [Rhizopogon vinicolor AM-OR11-026]|uniref:p-loop containing nucleoside triphosphate hydrolase protein n=1 Tax=Rhizopogon vinicolor AM-OR11-026 TaxID=1314800 RepID=A0A1B7N9T5_9AGAM|nr:P-loop containing nucleoside triphosphate hydrolase protein [Rhizopogon vinicolor AM-OR11-026]